MPTFICEDYVISWSGGGIPVPTPDPGFCLVVDSDGNYLLDSDGNYIQDPCAESAPDVGYSWIEDSDGNTLIDNDGNYLQDLIDAYFLSASGDRLVDVLNNPLTEA
jgi:hypothetical protein